MLEGYKVETKKIDNYRELVEHRIPDRALLTVVNRADWIFVILVPNNNLRRADTVIVAGEKLLVVRILSDGRVVAQTGTSGTLRQRAALLRVADHPITPEETFEIELWLAAAEFDKKVAEL